MSRRLLIVVGLPLGALLVFLNVRRQVLDRRALGPVDVHTLVDRKLFEPAHLTPFHIRQQEEAHSCGPATISMVVSYLGDWITEHEYVARAGLSERKKGMLPRVFHRYLSEALPSNTVELVVDARPADVLRTIHAQLAAGIPVPVYFATENARNPGTTDTHYSAVIGMSLEEGYIRIANVYGFEEDVRIEEFFDRLSFQNLETEPFLHRLATMIGYIAKNNLYVITPADQY